MPRRSKDELMAIKREKIIKDLINSLRYLNNPKYHKNNFWSIAAWDSWAAQGKAGSCSCGCGYYNGSLCNTRRHTERGGGVEHCKHVREKFCNSCINLIENKVNVKFTRRY